MCGTRDQALSLARESVQADVAAFGEEQREQLRLKFKSLDEIEGGFGTALVESFPDFLPRPEMLGASNCSHGRTTSLAPRRSGLATRL